MLDDLRLALEALPVPPRPALEVELALGRQVDLVRVVQPAPRLGRVERMVRIGKEAQTQNGASRFSLMKEMVRSPIQVELWKATGSAEWNVCIAVDAAAAASRRAAAAPRRGRPCGTSARSAGRAAASSAASGCVLRPPARRARSPCRAVPVRVLVAVAALGVPVGLKVCEVAKCALPM